MLSKIISHSKASVENVKTQQLKLQAFRTYECELCVLSKTYCISF